jgi:hypothetical protein
MRGAGGTDGGIGEFLLGLGMFVAGGYLLLSRIQVHSGFGWGSALFSVGGQGVPSGMVLVPFMLGVVVVFYNARNPIGWLLAAGSVVALVVGVIANVEIRLARMSLFDLLTILVLALGGLGLLLRGLRDHRPKKGSPDWPRGR